MFRKSVQNIKAQSRRKKVKVETEKGKFAYFEDIFSEKNINGLYLYSK